MSRLSSFERISSGREFDKIYKNAEKTWHASWFVMFYVPGTEKKVAFVASKKVGNAVKRNRAKRILRALFLKYLTNTKEGSYIFVAKASLPAAEFTKVDKAFRSALHRSGLI